MNYLAHAFLSDKNEESIIGNLLGDFVKGKPDVYYKGEILRWIVIHRKIDSFTDTHSIFRSSKRLISPYRRRFSGIIIDICFDHFLAKNWLKYSEQELSEFISKVYNILEGNKNILPLRLSNILPRLISENWFGSYKTVSGVELTLKRISKRFKREIALNESIEEIVLNYDKLEENFFNFFPQLISYVDKLKKTLIIDHN